MINVRDYAAADQTEARLLIEAGLGEHFGHVDSSLNPDLDDIHATYVASGGRFYVAEFAGILVGTLGLQFRDNAAQVVRVSTHPGHRRRGVASALLARAIREARTAGYLRLVVYTQPEWLDSMGFYVSHGFVEYGRDDIDVHLRLDLGSERCPDVGPGDS